MSASEFRVDDRPRRRGLWRPLAEEAEFTDRAEVMESLRERGGAVWPALEDGSLAEEWVGEGRGER